MEKQRITFTDYRKKYMSSVTGITVHQYSPEAWKGKQVLISPLVTEPVYIHERGQKLPSVVMLPENWREDADSIAALFSRVGLGGGHLTVQEEGKRDLIVQHRYIETLRNHALAVA